MKIVIDPGKYVIAVSGGVDSMVLLDLLRGLSGVELVIAHLDHGIRPDSALDRQLVATAAQAYGLPFEYREANLGATASEAEARTVRYAFLDEVRQRHQAQAIVTAHHQDDVLETALLNLIRGTGRKGLSSLRSTTVIVRPLLYTSKQTIRKYAETYHIQWREDSTNNDERYMRNFVRRQLMPRLSAVRRQQLVDRLSATADVNEQLDNLLLAVIDSHSDDQGLERQWFTQLPHDVSREVMATWLREQGIRDFGRKTIERLVVAAKTAITGKTVDVIAGYQLGIGKRRLVLTSRGTSQFSTSMV